MAVARDAETGEPVLLRPRPDGRASPRPRDGAGGGVGPHRPAAAPGEVGSVSFHYRARPQFTGRGDDFARRLGTLLSLAFENAKLYSTQREIADTLQTALLTVPRRIPGIDFGYLYRSATATAEVGGDFYDFFALDGDRAGVLLGDVSGKGVQAATLTALVKNTIRALAYENDSPAGVVSKTNAVIFKATPGSIFVTLLFGVLDVATGRLVYCSAGHTRGIVKTREGDVDAARRRLPAGGRVRVRGVRGRRDHDREGRRPGPLHRRRHRGQAGRGAVRRGAARRVRPAPGADAAEEGARGDLRRGPAIHGRQAVGRRRDRLGREERRGLEAPPSACRLAGSTHARAGASPDTRACLPSLVAPVGSWV